MEKQDSPFNITISRLRYLLAWIIAYLKRELMLCPRCWRWVFFDNYCPIRDECLDCIELGPYA